MGISTYNIKRWAKMLTGKSIYHVDQGLGQVIDAGGYYNDLTQKVLMGDANLDEEGIPFLEHSDGSHVKMPTMIFQYGLGAYDLWLIKQEEKYQEIVRNCADWACVNIQENGAWNNFFYIYPDNPYCAMTQGEGISLLVRAYDLFHSEKYLLCAQKAVRFLLLDSKDGGVAKYEGSDLILLEYTHLPVVLNGWIFALWGLYDYNRFFNDFIVKKAYDDSLRTLIGMLPMFSLSYWSKYDLKGMIASPFYHHLHIAQMKAMVKVSQHDVFGEYATKWEAEEKNLVNKSMAFMVKAVQKIVEKE